MWQFSKGLQLQKNYAQPGNSVVKISLCLLVWNELEGCKIDVPNLPRDSFEETYAVDGGSTDGTVEYLESQGIPVYRQPKSAHQNH